MGNGGRQLRWVNPSRETEKLETWQRHRRSGDPARQDFRFSPSPFRYREPTVWTMGGGGKATFATFKSLPIILCSLQCLSSPLLYPQIDKSFVPSGSTVVLGGIFFPSEMSINKDAITHRLNHRNKGTFTFACYTCDSKKLVRISTHGSTQRRLHTRYHCQQSTLIILE